MQYFQNAAAQVITYTYTVSNTGDVPLTGVSLSDDNFTPTNTADDFSPTLSSNGNGDNVLDVGESWTYTASYTATQADIDSGADLVNVATADTDQTQPKTDDETVDVVQNPNFSIVKEADVTSVDGAGDVINYTYTVTNTGNQTLTNVSLIDDNFTAGDTSDDFNPTFDTTSDNGNGVLDVGETWEYTASHTVTQTEIDNGDDLVNVATADSDETAPKTDNETVDVVQNPNFSIVKEADVTEVDGAGDVINYTYTVTNTGNQTLTNVSLIDDNFTAGDTSDDFNPTFDTTSDNGNGVLDVGETWEYTASYTATQADIDKGTQLVNVATADSDQTEPEDDSEQVQVFQDPNLSIVKDADVTTVDGAGDVINYTYTVTNTGNVSLTNVSLSDDNFTPSDTSDDFNPTFDSSSDDGNGVLDVGETWEYTASYTATQADIDSGADLVNVATADSNETDPKTDDETVDVVQNPNLSIVKDADVTTVDDAGDVINYTYTVTNTGNQTLTNVSLIDDNFTPADTSDDFNPTFDTTSDDGNGVLDVGETWEYTASYTATQTDIDSGADLVNIATADSDQTQPKTDDEKVTITQNPNLEISKTADVSEVDAVGDVINYTYTLTNTGNVSLSDVTLSDDNFTPANTGDDFSPTLSSNGNGDNILDVGETWEYTASYTVTQADIDSGADLVNVATVDTEQTDPKTDDEKVDVIQEADFLLLKDADVTQVDADGDVINYTYTLTNTGNVSLTGITLSDDNFTPANTSDDFSPVLSTNGNGDNILDVGETWTYTASYTATQADIDNGADLVNVATADTDQTDPKTDNETVDVIQRPNLSIIKDADVSEVDAAGDVINYTYTLTNTGNQTLTNVSLSDDNFTPADTSDDFNPTFDSTSDDGNGVLDVGETWEYTASYTVTQTDIDSGVNLVNVATADTDETDPKTDDETVNVLQIPSITIDKVTSDGVVTGDNIGVSAGQSITWTYKVTNDGNLNLSNINLSDDQQGAITNLVDNGDGDSILAPDETWVYEASGTAIFGDYQNIGTVTGDYTDDGETKSVTDADPSSYTGIAAPGVRTPGFWINWTEVWDGDASNDSRFAGRSGFPGSDILLAPYSASAEAPEVIDPVSGQYSEGILVGDYNRDGITNNGENTIFYSLNEAKSILAASKKVEKNDKRYTLDRSLIASWLNNLAFNPAPIDDINDGIAWIQEHTPDENGDGVGDGNLILGASTYAVPASSDFWNEEDLVAGLPSGNSIHTALDNYNNFGI
ncbi:beta strand repeat-containing protein [Coleofasciculus sp. F4-SAH-05]|uniref:beta strand repeat-containing protein n=1 Tax=Coleofasciculus sp. F4-SAH-05 TaxID=3069525 RepID=UPI00406326DD